MVDWNEDGREDLVSGDTKGQIWVFLDTTKKKKAAPVLASGFRVKADGKEIEGARLVAKVGPDGTRKVEREGGSHPLADSYSKIHVADWDGDGRFDLLVGQTRDIVLYRNRGAKGEPEFEAPVRVEAPEGGFPTRPSPFVVDWDGDGTRDLLVGAEQGGVFFFRNAGRGKTWKLEKGVPLTTAGEPLATGGSRTRFTVTHWDGDGHLDLVVGDFWSKDRQYGGHVVLFRGEGSKAR